MYQKVIHIDPKIHYFNSNSEKKRLTKLTADRPHLRDYQHSPLITDTQRSWTDNDTPCLMPMTDGQTDGCCQVHFLPAK